MTVETQTNRVRYIGNGLTKNFPVPFPVLQPEHLRLYLWADRRQTEITEGFIVIGAGTSSVTVALDTAPAAGTTLTILRRMPLVQMMDLRNGGAFNAETLEGSADDQEMQIQQMAEEIGRAIVFPEGMTEDRPDYNLLLGLKDDAEAARDDAWRASDEAWEAVKEAESITSTIFLESGVYNAETAFVLDAPLASGSLLTLPVKYYPTRNVLSISYAGQDCVRLGVGIGDYAYQYEEIGDDPNVATDQIRIHFDADPDMVFHVWVVTSALGKNLDALEALKEDAETAAANAANSETNAAGSEATALTAAGEASTAADSADKSALAAGNSATAADLSAQAALASEAKAALSETAAGQSADAASVSAANADTSARAAAASAGQANSSATQAAGSAQDAGVSAGAAQSSADDATASATAAQGSAQDAEVSKDTVAGWLADGFDASKIVSGMIDIDRIPAAAVQHMIDVDDDDARFALTTDDVQNFDTVHVVSTGLMYKVIDDTKLNSEDGYKQYTAGRASAVDWSGVENKPAAYTPESHAATHGSGGSDPVTPAAIGALPASGKAVDSAKADAVPWAGVSGKPSTFAPSAHAASHKTGGADALAASDIGAAPANITLADNVASDTLPATASGTQQSKIQALRDNVKSLFAKVASAIGLGGTPSTQAFGDAAAEGASSNAARADHKHGMPAAPTISAATAATATADGSAGTAVYARDSDSASRNKAATPAGVAALIAATPAVPATTALTAALAAGAAFTVPQYVVGRGKLVIFLNGAYCAAGASNTFQYKEVGTVGAASTTINFYDALAVGDTVTAISLP